MKGIISVNNIGMIGLNNKLIWRSTKDLLHFKNMTINSKIIVGFNTFKTLPILPSREIIIDSRKDLHKDFESFDWCIGGKKTYEKYSPFFTELHISHINDNTIGDCIFPDFRNLKPDCKIFNYYFDINES
jgi:dihydrofolate reductase